MLLRARAQQMERDWLEVPDRCGHYNDRVPGRLHGLVSEIGAGWVIYTAVMASWLYVAGRGAQLDERLFEGWPWLLAVLAVCIVWLGVRFWDPTRKRAFLRDTTSSART